MKKILSFLLLSLPALAANAQNTDSASASAAANAGAGMAMNNTVLHKLKSNDQVLPRWAIDIGYRYGWLNQTMETIDLKAAYGPNNLSSSRYAQPTFKNGSGMGGDLMLSYFFNHSRTLGVGIGAQYMHYTGSITMDTMYSDYQNTDNKGRTYRQIIRSNGPLTEDVSTNNLNIPVLLRFKHQFGRATKPSNFGITADAGAVFGIYNTTEATASGRFSYEAVYKVSPTGDKVSGFDAGLPPNADGSSFVITEQAYINSHAQNDGGGGKWLDDLRRQNEGFNVGLNKAIAPSQRTQSSNYNDISYGAIAQLGMSYQLSYHVTFMLSGYGMYQSFTNKGNENYHPTDNVVDEAGTLYGSYRPLTSGMKKADYTSFGVSAGFRIFFGEKRDVDGDGIPDATDRCKLEYGEARFNGCPDRDHDGIADGEDACPDEPGGEGTNGCPDDDQDGVPNKLDACPTTFGELRNGCPVSEAVKYAAVDTTRTTRVENGTFLPPHIVLETDVLYFDYGRSDIQDSTARVLDYALRVLNKEPKVVIYISGFTDDIGNEKSNLFLSYQRAKSAKNYFAKKGIDPKRIIIGSYGMDSPAVPNNTPQGKARNRRIEMKLLLPL